MEMKHAYLIMAHNNFESLKYLLKAIDDDRNDIYLHIDKKTSYVDLEEIRTWVTKAGLFFAPRIKVFWGHFSVVQCELNLLRMATSKGKYHYYHFLSGVDYPIKSQDEIHECLKDCNKEFVTYHENGTAGDIFDYKMGTAGTSRRTRQKESSFEADNQMFLACIGKAETKEC